MKELMKLSKIKRNPDNPRLIKDDKFKKLVQSLIDFPEMMEKRPIVVDENYIVLGGNMRLAAAKEAGLKEVWIDKADDWTEQQKKEFIIKDNVSFGEWDFDLLLDQYDLEDLDNFGVDFDGNDVDYSEKNKEIDIEELNEIMELKFKFNEKDYWKVKNNLLIINENQEKALLILIENKNE